MPNQETGIAGELVLALRNHLNDQLLGDVFSAGRKSLTDGISFVQLSYDAARIRGVRGLQCLQGPVLGLLDCGTDFVVIGCHLDALLSPALRMVITNASLQHTSVCPCSRVLHGAEVRGNPLVTT